MLGEGQIEQSQYRGDPLLPSIMAAYFFLFSLYCIPPFYEPLSIEGLHFFMAEVALVLKLKPWGW